MIPRFAFSLVLACFAGGLASAQEPQIGFELETDTVVVGQPLVLRIKVLVPTWMPNSPDFPTLEVPSLMVRLPERATNPISERIDGETWSGVQRAYRLYPLAAGEYQLPAGEVAITYADPDTTDPISYSTPLPDIGFEASLPKVAEHLSPPVLAKGFELEQTIDGESELAVGDAITRTLSAHIEGTTPVLIPQLAKESDATALRPYPKDPVVTESEDRGTLSGTRIETTTYVAQTDGTIALPEVAIDWFNLETGKIETASVPEILLTVTGAPPKPPEPADIAKWLGLASLALAIGWGVFKWLLPTIAQWMDAQHDNWRNSEHHAHHAVVAAIAQQDLFAVMVALNNWKAFAPADASDNLADLNSALAKVGAARFGVGEQQDAPDHWRQVGALYRKARARIRTTRRASSTHSSLPPLNP
ncbi:hypothetical protein [Sedimentitalea todarodis]|uniref:Protein BatD n=1 Tax=Sedimentitalea todarodis TaxID=1631240 RepID=A0ABU3VF23_9RHOB|nr:hypothetical protein [Sedimentitalea todarodis]MDU9004782.1 hypothetical protein [Sedimentitalea todarodis]